MKLVPHGLNTSQDALIPRKVFAGKPGQLPDQGQEEFLHRIPGLGWRGP